MMMSSKHQSTGGMKVWRKLHKDPDVHVHALDHYDDAHHVNRVGRGETHTSGKDVEDVNKRQHSGPGWEKASALYRLKRRQNLQRLVAHKKED